MENYTTNLIKLHKIYGGEKEVFLSSRRLLTELMIQRDSAESSFRTVQVNSLLALVCD